jgi:hypothetical protein
VLCDLEELKVGLCGQNPSKKYEDYVEQVVEPGAMGVKTENQRERELERERERERVRERERERE